MEILNLWPSSYLWVYQSFLLGALDPSKSPNTIAKAA